MTDIPSEMKSGLAIGNWDNAVRRGSTGVQEM